MKTFLSKFVDNNGEPTELTMRISYGVVGFIASCAIVITYTLIETKNVYHFGIYG